MVNLIQDNLARLPKLRFTNMPYDSAFEGYTFTKQLIVVDSNNVNVTAGDINFYIENPPDSNITITAGGVLT